MKATEDDSKRSPTRRRLFGPVDHNQNKVDASLIWTNINPGFPRVDYSPRFRPRPPALNADSVVREEAGRGDQVETMEDEGEVEGDDVVMDDGSGGVVMTTMGGYEREEGEPDERRRRNEGGTASVQCADDFVASLNYSARRRWTQTGSHGDHRSDDMASTSNLPSAGGRPASPSGCGSAGGSSAVRRRRPASEHHHSPTDDDLHTESSSSSYSGSVDPPSCRTTSRPATCPWRTLARVDPGFTDDGRMRSASLGHTSRPSCCGSRHRSCRHTTTAAEGGSRGGSPNLEPTYRKVPVVQLRGADLTTVFCPPGRTYFFKPIGGGGSGGGGGEDSPALTASQSPDEGGGDDESSGGTRGSIVDPSRLQQKKTVASAEEMEKEEVEEVEEEEASLDSSVLCGPEAVGGDDDSRLGREVVEEEEEEKEEERCPLPQQQQQHQSGRRRRQSINETYVSLERDDDEEEEVAEHDCSDRETRNEEDEEGRAAAAAVDRGRERLSGRRIKDKLVTTPPKAKKRKPYEDGNSDSSY